MDDRDLFGLVDRRDEREMPVEAGRHHLYRLTFADLNWHYKPDA